MQYQDMKYEPLESRIPAHTFADALVSAAIMLFKQNDIQRYGM